MNRNGFVKLVIWIPLDMKDKLDSYADINNTSRSLIVRKAINDFIY